MLRQDHELMIEQPVDGETHWTIIKLIDKSEGFNGHRDWNTGPKTTGIWRTTRQSHNDSQPVFTSDNPEYW